MAKRRKLVEVEWVDSAFHKGWFSPNQLVVPATCRTTGYLVASEDTHVVVAMSSEDSGEYSEAMAIPRGCIIGVMKVDVRR